MAHGNTSASLDGVRDGICKVATMKRSKGQGRRSEISLTLLTQEGGFAREPSPRTVSVNNEIRLQPYYNNQRE